MSNPAATAMARLRKDYLQIKKDPVPYITAEPMPNNFLEWHYVINGPPDSPYCGGYYHGKLRFPKEYPFRPPSIFMITPSGRFRTNMRLCLSMSDYHPDSWNPSWTASTILAGLLSFMLESTDTLGAIETTTAEKLVYAQDSLKFNLKDASFRELFPDLCQQIRMILESQQGPRIRNSTASLISTRFKRYMDFLKSKILRRGT